MTAKLVGGDEIVLRFLLQTLKNPSRFRPAASRSKAVGKLRLTQQCFPALPAGLLRFRDRFSVQSFLGIDTRQPEVRSIVLGIKLQGFLAVLDGPIIVSGIVQRANYLGIVGQRGGSRRIAWLICSQASSWRLSVTRSAA